MHAEAGGDLIDDNQEEIRKLLDKFHVEQARILRQGFFHYRVGGNGRRQLRASSTGWRLTAQALEPQIRLYKLNGEEWNGPIAGAIGRQSIAEWLGRKDESRLQCMAQKSAADAPKYRRLRFACGTFFSATPMISRY